jgi:hypothetical protein
MNGLKRFSEFLYQRTSWKVMMIAVVIFFLFSATVFPLAAHIQKAQTGTADMPDTLILASADDYYGLAESYGEVGRSAYIWLRFTFDLAWPVVYGFALTALLSVLLKDEKRGWMRNLNLLPLVGVLSDLSENVLSVVYMARYPEMTDWSVLHLPYITLFKWLVLGFALFVILALLGKRGIICITHYLGKK